MTLPRHRICLCPNHHFLDPGTSKVCREIRMFCSDQRIVLAVPYCMTLDQGYGHRLFDRVQTLLASA